MKLLNCYRTKIICMGKLKNIVNLKRYNFQIFCFIKIIFDFSIHNKRQMLTLTLLLVLNIFNIFYKKQINLNKIK